MHRPTDFRASRGSRSQIVQVLGTFAMAAVLVLALAHMKREATDAPAGEASRVAGIAAADLERELATPRPTVPPPGPQAGEPTRESGTARRAAPRKPQPQQPAVPAATAAGVAEAEPGPPLPLVPPQPPDSFVAAAGKTSLAVLRTSADFVTRTVPDAVVATTREAVDKAKSVGTAVLDRVTP